MISYDCIHCLSWDHMTNYMNVYYNLCYIKTDNKNKAYRKNSWRKNVGVSS